MEKPLQIGVTLLSQGQVSTYLLSVDTGLDARGRPPFLSSPSWSSRFGCFSIGTGLPSHLPSPVFVSAYHCAMLTRLPECFHMGQGVVSVVDLLSHFRHLYPMDCSLPGSSVHGKNIGAGCHFLLRRDLSHPGIEPASLASPALQVDSLLLSHWGSPSFRINIRK